MMKQIVRYLLGILLMLSVSKPCIAAPTGDSGLQRIDLQLRWHHQFQFAGYYAALEKGYYREEGLEVRLHEAKAGIKPVEEVLAGRAQYAESNSDVLYARLQGKPVVALAAVFQHSPLVLLTLKSSAVHTPKDLVGKKVMLLNPRTDAYFHAMLRNESIRETELEMVPSSLDLEDLISGKVAAFNSYLTNEPFVLQQRGIDYSVLNPADYGIDFYSDILFTTEQEVKEHPLRARAVLRATLKGWRYAMDHPDEIIDLLLTKYRVPKSREHLRYEAEAMRSLIQPDVIEIGHMNRERWERMANAFVELGMANEDFSVPGFLYDPHSPVALEKMHEMLIFFTLVSGLATFSAVGILCGWIHLKHEISMRRMTEAQIKQLAYYDPLTAIANRNSFLPYANKQIHQADRNRQKLALCFIDLNDFKEINDRYGHKAGDSMLIHVANAINSVIRESDMAARIGGDEFVVLLTDIRNVNDTRRSVDEIQQAIAAEIRFATHTLSITASIGIAVYPDDGIHIDELIAKADSFMYVEKQQTKAQALAISRQSSLRAC